MVGLFLCEKSFQQKQTNHKIYVCYCNRYSPPSPKEKMISHVITIKEVVEMKKQTKTKIGVGYVVKAKVGELENSTSGVRIKRIRK